MAQFWVEIEDLTRKYGINFDMRSSKRKKEAEASTSAVDDSEETLAQSIWHILFNRFG